MVRLYPLLIALLACPGSAAVTHALEFQDVLTNDAIPGWEVKGGAAGIWQVTNGVLSCTGGQGGWIQTQRDYTDFVFEFDYLLPPGGNSGVFIRTPETGHPSTVGMEVQILDDYADKHKHIKPAQHCGSLYMIAAAAKEVTRPAGQWNHMRIMADRDRIVVDINGERIVDADGQSHPEILKRSLRGPIGLQNHGTQLQFKNIRLADLAADRARRSQWWRDAKFGMFIHWGVYSVIGEGEWIMKVRKIPAAEYEKRPPQFNPTGFDAAEWISLAKRAGQKYVVITSKHHDGFAMYDSAVSDYDLMDATPYKRDPMKGLAAECAKQGLKFGFYHSILDWHHPDYAPVPEWDKEGRVNHEPDFDRYLAYMKGQVRELCTNYGPLACWWWDGGWDHKDVAGRQALAEVNAMVRQLQPDILINNRANLPEDFSTPEQYIPPTGLSGPDGAPMLWENCITLTTGHGSHQPTAWWGYDRHETEYKTADFCIRMLIDIVSKGGNLLLNVGPTPEGTIQRAEAKVLEAVGRWLAVNGEAIYGTTSSPFRHLPFFGKATVKANRLYLHVFDWPADGVLSVPGLKNEVRRAWLLANPGESLGWRARPGDVVLAIPPTAPDPVASVIAVELDGPPRVERMEIVPEADGIIPLPALYGEIRGKHGQRARLACHEGKVHVTNWTNKKDLVAWQFETREAGHFDVLMEYAAEASQQGGQFEVSAGSGQGSVKMNVGGSTMMDVAIGRILDVDSNAVRLEGTVENTGGKKRFKSIRVGTIELAAGRQILAVKAVRIPKDNALMDLRQITLIPKEVSSATQTAGQD